MFVIELDTPPDPLAVLAAYADRADPLLLESVRKSERLGRYSYFTCDPVKRYRLDTPTYGVDPFAAIADSLRLFETERNPDLPPFQGGVAGLLGYELGGCFERLPVAASDPLSTPALCAGLYDTVLAWDHFAERAWLLSRGLSGTRSAPNSWLARERVTEWKTRIENASAVELPAGRKFVTTPLPETVPLPGHDGIVSNFSRREYHDAVSAVVEHIRAGDIFQANLSQQLSAACPTSPERLYAAVREHNPAPLAGFYRTSDFAIVSGSPERFVQVSDRRVETCPIKGTRGRSPYPEADFHLRSALEESEKDRAENVMIVDLLRNDLSRVCEPLSVRVPELWRVETYETVLHLVSTVVGQLEEGKTALDLVAASFPGGSITGAPKIRAMQVITELERTARGPYCGSLFWHSFAGDFDSSILIRTFLVKEGRCVFPVGGGIVVDSTPEAEYEETLHKAEGSLRALRSVL